jgi:hypothetical protein
MMAICLIVENVDASQEAFEQISAHVRSTGPVPPDGARLVLGGPSDPGRRMISVWDSQEAQERFVAERLAPAYKAAGLSFDSAKKTLFEVDTLIAGDLTGVPQPA